MGIEDPMGADAALKPQLLAVGGEQQLDGRPVVTDAMVQGLHFVFGVDTLDDHHAHKDVFILDFLGIAGKKRLHGIRLVSLNDVVHPTGRDIHSGQFIGLHNLVHLGDDNAVFKGGGLHNYGGLLGIVTGVKPPVLIGLVRRNEADLGSQVHKEPPIQLHIGVDGTDAELLLRQHLSQPEALHPGKGEIQFLGNALFKKIQMFVPRNRGDEHIEVMYLFGIHLGQRPGQESCLLLVAAFQHHPVSRTDNPLQERNDIFGKYHFPIGVLLHLVLPLQLGSSLVIPDHCHFSFLPPRRYNRRNLRGPN